MNAFTAHTPTTASPLPPHLGGPRALLFLLIVLLSGALFSFTPGCAHKPTAQALAYFTLADTRVAVDKAERLYGDAVVAGKVTPAQERDVDQKIVRFHAAFKLAVKAARADYRSATPDSLQALADELIVAIETFAKPK